MAKKRDPYLDQAMLESSLQIDPQAQALLSLMADSRNNYITTRGVNASNARGIQEAAFRGARDLQQTYGAQDPQHPTAGGLLAAMSAGATNPEGQAALQRMLGEYGQAQEQFANTGLQAETARVYGNKQARDQYMADKDKFANAYTDLLAQSGKLTAATYGKLIEGRRERQADREATSQQALTSERNSVRSSGYDPDTGLPIPGGPADVNDPRDQKDPKNKPGAFKEATNEQYQKATSQIQEAISHAKTMVEAGASRADVGQALVQGIPNQKKDGKTIPGVPKIEQPYVTAALDVVFDEHLSRKTQQNLNQQGIKVKKLGLPTYGAWKKAAGRRSSSGTAKTGAPNIAGDLLANLTR